MFVAEIGDVTRFPSPDRLCSWAGMTPKPPRVRHQGAARLDHQTRVAGCCAGRRSRRSQKNHAGGDIKDAYRRIAERRGRNIAKVAAGRKVLTLVYYGLRDGEIRCLAQAQGGDSSDAASRPARRSA